MARDTDERTERDPRHERVVRPADRQAGDPKSVDRGAGDTDAHIERQAARGLSGRAAQRRSDGRTRSSRRDMDARTTGAWELSDESRSYSSGGYPSGAYSSGDYSGPRGRESVHDREVREARRRDVGPYPESRTPRHQGLPSDLRAGEGDWAQSGGYAELPRDRGGYEARYQPGEWTPGGDASVPLRMGYGDYGVRHEPAGLSDESPLTVVAGDVMSDDIGAVRPDEALHDVVRLMSDRQVLRVPVVERGDRLVGIDSMADVATRADSDRALQGALEEIPARRSFWSRFFGG